LLYPDFCRGEPAELHRRNVRHYYATFAPARKQIDAASAKSVWLGQEYWRLRGDGVEMNRKESYGILQAALRNYARWVDQADGVEVWLPANQVGNLY
jgi:hypothetical protein